MFIKIEIHDVIYDATLLFQEVLPHFWLHLRGTSLSSWLKCGYANIFLQLEDKFEDRGPLNTFCKLLISNFSVSLTGKFSKNNSTTSAEKKQSYK